MGFVKGQPRHVRTILFQQHVADVQSVGETAPGAVICMQGSQVIRGRHAVVRPFFPHQEPVFIQEVRPPDGAHAGDGKVANFRIKGMAEVGEIKEGNATVIKGQVLERKPVFRIHAYPVRGNPGERLADVFRRDGGIKGFQISIAGGILPGFKLSAAQNQSLHLRTDGIRKKHFVLPVKLRAVGAYQAVGPCPAVTLVNGQVPFQKHLALVHIRLGIIRKYLHPGIRHHVDMRSFKNNLPGFLHPDGAVIGNGNIGGNLRHESAGKQIARHFPSGIFLPGFRGRDGRLLRSRFCKQGSPGNQRRRTP